MTKSERDRLIGLLRKIESGEIVQRTHHFEGVCIELEKAIIRADTGPEKCPDCGSEMIEVCSGLEAVCKQAATTGHRHKNALGFDIPETLDDLKKSAPAGDDVVDAAAEAMITELKRQNLAETKDVGRTKYRILVGVGGIADVKLLAKAALAAYEHARKDGV